MIDQKKMATLNIRRIFAFAIVLLVLRIVASFVAADPVTSEAINAEVALKYLLRYLLDAAIVIAVFARLAQVQVQSPYIHAFLVVMLQELLGAALLFATVGSSSSSPLWWLDYLMLVLSVIAGTRLGLRGQVHLQNS
ncbi:MAG: hypothetical protein ACREO8_12590 [Luteimonas sp.]